MTLEFPFPDSHLLPNAARRLHYQARAKYAQTARMVGKVETINQTTKHRLWLEHNLDIQIEIVFHEPNARARDLDGMLSALKPTLDGMADALEVNDRQFNPIILRRGDNVKRGKVVVKFLEQGG